MDLKKDTLARAICDVILKGIDYDFWGEDSVLIDAFHDVTNEQLDCEGLLAYLNDTNNIVVEMGDYRFRVIVESIETVTAL